ncbi:hypothetical protein TSYNTROOL_09890 [Tepidanaerobacter syntrophicus]|nr:hypothetical protein TSYNTROOL_09890 [Tepidanaerobacter syntrophicus]
MGLSCKSKDAARVLKNSLAKRNLAKDMTLPKIRTDNGPQFTSNLFEETVKELGVIHERIPVNLKHECSHRIFIQFSRMNATAKTSLKVLCMSIP